jgi:hypothetical protein
MKLIPIDYNGGQFWFEEKLVKRIGDSVYTLKPVDFNIIKDIKGQSLNQSLPGIPYVEIPKRDYSLEAAKQFCLDNFKQSFTKHPLGGYMSNEGLVNIINVCVEAGYKFGKKGSSKQFDNEDLRKALLAGITFGRKHEYGSVDVQEELQFLQPKVASIEVDIEIGHFGNLYAFEVPKTFQKGGKTYVEVKSVQYEKESRLGEE